MEFEKFYNFQNCLCQISTLREYICKNIYIYENIYAKNRSKNYLFSLKTYLQTIIAIGVECICLEDTDSNPEDEVTMEPPSIDCGEDLDVSLMGNGTVTSPGTEGRRNQCFICFPARRRNPQITFLEKT